MYLFRSERQTSGVWMVRETIHPQKFPFDVPMWGSRAVPAADLPARAPLSTGSDFATRKGSPDPAPPNDDQGVFGLYATNTDWP
jgi:hypothetical protein